MDRHYERGAGFFAALGHPVRLKILELLTRGPLRLRARARDRTRSVPNLQATFDAQASRNIESDQGRRADELCAGR